MYEGEEGGWLLCYIHRCLQEEMRQRLKSEIDLTRKGECLLSKNKRLMETDGESMQSFDFSIVRGGLSQSELECFRMPSNAFE
jgi:hypothetical protein